MLLLVGDTITSLYMEQTSKPRQLPLHLLISESLRQQIVGNEYSSGRLPSERQLMSQFNASRITVRRAIANLVDQGLVVRQHGKGVFVKEQHKVTRSLSNPFAFFDEDMARQEVTSSIKSLSFEVVEPAAKVCQKLDLSSENRVYCQKKTIFTDDIPVSVDITYIRFDLGEAFAQELQSSLIYPVLDSNGIPIERVDTTLECTHATYELSEYLGIVLGAPLLVNRYVAYTTDSQPVICGETLSRADRLCYSVVLKRKS